MVSSKVQDMQSKGYAKCDKTILPRFLQSRLKKTGLKFDAVFAQVAKTASKGDKKAAKEILVTRSFRHIAPEFP
jgi:hypothetical protein